MRIADHVLRAVEAAERWTPGREWLETVRQEFEDICRIRPDFSLAGNETSMTIRCPNGQSLSMSLTESDSRVLIRWASGTHYRTPGEDATNTIANILASLATAKG